MADLERIVNIVFAGEDRISEALRGINNSLGKFESGMKSVAGPFADIANKVLEVDAALLVVGAGIAKLRSDFDASTGKIQASIGVTGERAEELGEIAKKVFAESFTGSMDEAVKAVSLIEQKFKDFDLNEDQIKEMAKKAFSFTDLWEADTQETLKTVKSLMENFDIGEDVAFDFLAKGFQEGLDSAGDFYDTINEYSVQFGAANFEAEEFFSVIKTGFQEGVLGTDKAADAFKEYTLRMVDWKNDTSAAFKSLQELGLDPQKMLGLDQAESFQIVIDKLKGVEDAADQTRLGAALIGTQFEDLKKAALNIDVAKYKMDDLAGAAAKVDEQYQSLGKTLASVWRGVSAEISSMDAFDSLEEEAIAFFQRLAGELPKAIAGADYSGMLTGLKELSGSGNDLMNALGFDLSSAEGIQEAVQRVIDTVTNLINLTKGMAESWEPFFSAIGTAVDWLNDLDRETAESLGNLLGIAQQVTIAAGAFTGLSAVFSGASGLISGFGGLAKALAPLAGPSGLLIAAGAGGAAVGTMIRDLSPEVDNITQDIIGWADSILDFSGTQGKANQSIEETEQAIRQEIEAMQGLADETGKTAEKLTELDGKTVSIETRVDSALNDAFADIDALTENPVEIGMSIDDFRNQMDEIVSFTGDQHAFKVAADEKSLKDTKAAVGGISEEVKITPKIEQDILDNELKLMIAQIDASSEIVQSKLEWEAKLDIAEAEANAEILTAYAQNISDAYASTADVIGDAFGALAGLDFGSAAALDVMDMIEDQLKLENELRQEQLELQKKLVESQTAMNNAKAKAMEEGTPLVNISIDGINLEAELRDVARRTIEWIQIEATEEGLEGLLGAAI